MRQPCWRPAVEVPTVDFSELKTEGGMRWPLPTTNQPELKASVGSPVKQILTLTAQARLEPRKGVFVYDMGQNMVGVPEITFRGTPGTGGGYPLRRGALPRPAGIRRQRGHDSHGKLPGRAVH